MNVELTERGLPTFTIGENAAWDNWVWNDEIEQKVESADALYFGTLGQRGESSPCWYSSRPLKMAIASQIPCILDINLRAPFYDDALDP